MPFGLILFVLLVGVPIVEVATFIEVGSRIGLWPTIALVILTALAGTWIIRWQGMGLLATVQRQMQEGRPPVFEAFSGVCLLLAGGLLFTRGFVTDTCGFILFWPPFRRLVYTQVGRRVDLRTGTHRAGGYGEGPAGPRSGKGPVIEGDFEELDDPQDMPPPRGGWGADGRGRQ